MDRAAHFFAHARTRIHGRPLAGRRGIAGARQVNKALVGCGNPALGPRLVFFTGGTALRRLSQELTRHTHNSVHLVTPFDSGGSSAALRRALAMPAVGDMRNRLLALADRDLTPARVLQFCATRLADNTGQDDAQTLRQQLRNMGSSRHAVWADMPSLFADALRLHLNYFLQHMPEDFDPFHACLGNLLLAGGYLHHRRMFGPVLAFFSRLLSARGLVLPVVSENLHLAARLEDGSLVVGQHHFKVLPAPVRQVFLTVHEPDRRLSAENGRLSPPCRPPLESTAEAYLRSAAAICYPMGSFYSSIVANLLPQGVGRAVAAASCPKIFIPSSGRDAELHGLSVADQAAMLVRYLRVDAPDAPTERLLHTVLVDSRHGYYEGGLEPVERVRLARMGVRLVDRHMVCENDPQCHVPELTVAALLEAVAPGADL
ncbi:MAG: GAK system CofD-like protein [Desulfovibrio sp.]|nr:GAK system CofD-like protein [Desulfovibrio sp.]